LKSAQPLSAPDSFSAARPAATWSFAAYARAIVPDHKQLRSGTLRRIIADAGLTVEEFMKLLRR
jgi:hypothetical protein